MKHDVSLVIRQDFIHSHIYKILSLLQLMNVILNNEKTK